MRYVFIAVENLDPGLGISLVKRGDKLTERYDLPQPLAKGSLVRINGAEMTVSFIRLVLGDTSEHYEVHVVFKNRVQALMQWNRRARAAQQQG